MSKCSHYASCSKDAEVIVAIKDDLKPFCFYHAGLHFMQKWPTETAEDIAYLAAEALAKRPSVIIEKLAGESLVLREMTEREEKERDAELERVTECRKAEP
jgi:hypothetical protein